MKTLESKITDIVGAYLERYQSLKDREGITLQTVAPVIKLKEEMFTKLKAFISDYAFESEEEEIHFFKEIKPNLFSKLIYYQKIYQLESMRPIGSKSVQIQYFEKELDRLTDFVEQNPDFYSYYRSGSTHLDRFFFTRSIYDSTLHRFVSF